MAGASQWTDAGGRPCASSASTSCRIRVCLRTTTAVLDHVPQRALRRPAGRRALQPLHRRAGLRRGARLRRRMRQRAPSERLRHHAVPQPDRLGSRPPHRTRPHRGGGQRPPALRPAHTRGRGVRHDRLHQRWTPHRRHGRGARASWRRLWRSFRFARPSKSSAPFVLLAGCCGIGRCSPRGHGGSWRPQADCLSAFSQSSRG